MRRRARLMDVARGRRQAMVMSTDKEKTTNFGSVATLVQLAELIGQKGPSNLTPVEVRRAIRAGKRLGVRTDARVAFLGTHNFEPLPDYVQAHGLGLGIGVGTYTAPYGQYMPQLLDPDSAVCRYAPHVLMLSCSIRQIAPDLHYDFASLPPATLASERERILGHVIHAAESAALRTAAVVLIANFPRPAYPAVGVADTKQKMSEAEFYLDLNLELIRRLKSADRIYPFDLDRLVGGLRPKLSERMFFVAKTVWDESSCSAVAQEVLRYVVAATGRTRKCLVVDLDNTIWKGVVGEDGSSGVQVGPGSASGEAFESHQRAIRSLRHRGVMLAVCSKNNQADVDEVFSARSDMPLKWGDFVAAEVGWADKASGVRQLAADLNIGEDSMLFLDDNPAERAIVRGELPAVIVPELPNDPADYGSHLRQLVYFEKLRVNDDDLTRLADYKAQRQRKKLHSETRDLDKYLASLETSIVVRYARQADLGRAHELFNKTNQFNLTTRRYTLAEVQFFFSDPAANLGIVSARDRFGSMGTIGVFLVRRDEDGWLLDSFLLSCRALGRGIGTAIMNTLKAEVTRRPGPHRLTAEFIPTAKNAPASGFLERQGFTLLNRRDDGSAVYVLEGAALEPRHCPHVSVSDKTGEEGRRSA